MEKIQKGFAIVSDLGIMYDGNGKSMSMTIFARESEIGDERRAVMIEGDKIVPVTISYEDSLKDPQG